MIDYIKILKIVLTEINNTIKLHTKNLIMTNLNQTKTLN